MAVLTIAGGEFVGQVKESNESGFIAVREVMEGDNPDPVTRKYCYPWSSIHSIKLLEEPEGEDDELLMGPGW